MKSKIIQGIPALFALAAIGFPYFSNWCIDSIPSCYGSWIHQIYQYLTSPLYFFTLYSLPLAIILIFIPRHIFNSWLKFSAWALPLAFIFIATTPIASHRMGIDFFPFYRGDAARLWGAIFAVASLVVLAFASARAHLYAGGKGYVEEETKRETGELQVLFVAGAGLISAAAAYWMMYVSPRGAFDMFLILGGISILTSLYVLGNAGVLMYRKKRNYMPLGWQLILAILLVCVSVAALSGAAVMPI